MQLVVSATPGTGKSTITKNAEQYGLNHCHVHYDNHTREYELTVPNSPLVPVFDSDSSLFDKTEFPGNYIKHIKEVLSKFPDVVIFVSSHDNVREAMAEAGIKYVLAYPERELKGDYLERYKERGSPERFIALMDEKWNDFIDSVQADKAERHLVLSEGEFLVDVLKSDLEATTSKVDSVFSTAIVSGNESIGDVVCDDVGQPVAVWGSNGLEPLPSEEPVADVVVVVDPLAVATPDPVPDTPDTAPAGEDAPQIDFSTAIITGSESIGDTVYNDIGTPVAIVGEIGLEAIPVEVVAEVVPEVPAEPVEPGASPEVLVDVNGEPKEEPPAAMDPQDTPVPVTSIPEQMQSPEPVPPVPGQPAVDAPEVQAPAAEVEVVVDPGAGTAEIKQGEDTVIVDNNVTTVAGNESSEENPTDLPVPDDNLPPALTEMDASELIENYYEINDDVTILEGVVEVCQTEARDGLEGYEDGGVVFQQATEHLKARYGKEIEPTLAGLEGFLDELKKVGTAVKRAFSDPKAAQAKVKRALWELGKAKSEYNSPAWQNKQEWINVGKTRLEVPGFLKECNTPEEVGAALKLAIKRVVDASEKYSKNDAVRHRAAIKVFNATKGWDPEEKTAEDVKELISSIPDALTGPVADAGLDELNTKMVSVELPVIAKTNVSKIVELMDMLTQASADMFKHEDSIPECLSWEQYQKNKFLVEHNASVIYNLISSEADEPGCSVISSAYYKQFLNVAKFLEMWILRSTK